MPVLLAPFFAIAGVAAGLAMIAVHMIARRRRTPRPLPTARFVSRAQQRSAALESRPRDVLSLFLRAAALAAAGLALSRPYLPPAIGGVQSLVIADLTGAESPQEVLDTALAIAGTNGAVVVSGDSVLVVDQRHAGGEVVRPSQPVPLTAALVESLRRAAAGGGPARLTIVSPFAAGSVDSATLAVRALWPGRADLIEAVRTPAPERGMVTVRSAPDDPLQAAVALLQSGAGARVTLLRDTLTGADSAAARAGQVVVHWPSAGLPEAFAPVSPDTVGGIAAEDYTFVVPLTRNAKLVGPSQGQRVVLRWLDGAAAAVELPLGAGCVRQVAVDAPTAGDLPVSRGFVRIVRAITDPCGVRWSGEPLSAAGRQALAGRGPAHAALERRAPVEAAATPLRVLLAFAIGALLLDLVARRRRG